MALLAGPRVLMACEAAEYVIALPTFVAVNTISKKSIPADTIAAIVHDPVGHFAVPMFYTAHSSRRETLPEQVLVWSGGNVYAIPSNISRPKDESKTINVETASKAGIRSLHNKLDHGGATLLSDKCVMGTTLGLTVSQTCPSPAFFVCDPRFRHIAASRLDRAPSRSVLMSGSCILHLNKSWETLHLTFDEESGRFFPLTRMYKKIRGKVRPVWHIRIQEI
jgi:hypothetical protein